MNHPPAGTPRPQGQPRTITLSMDPVLIQFLRTLAKAEDRNVSRVTQRLVIKGLTAENIPVPPMEGHA